MLFKIKDTAIKNGKKTTVTVNTESSELMNFLLGKDNKNPKDTMDAVFNEANQSKKKDIKTISKSKEKDSSVALKMEASKAKGIPEPKNKKSSLSRKAVTGKAKLSGQYKDFGKPERSLYYTNLRFMSVFNNIFDQISGKDSKYDVYVYENKKIKNSKGEVIGDYYKLSISIDYYNRSCRPYPEALHQKMLNDTKAVLKRYKNVKNVKVYIGVFGRVYAEFEIY